MSRSSLRTAGATVLVAVLAPALAAGTTPAVGASNSAAAHACQHGGWQDLATPAGQPFAGQGACTSYAARGGTLAPRLSAVQRWEALCLEAGGSFSIAADDDWRCVAAPDLALAPAQFFAMVDICVGASRFPGGQRNSNRVFVLSTCELDETPPF